MVFPNLMNENVKNDYFKVHYSYYISMKEYKNNGKYVMHYFFLFISLFISTEQWAMMSFRWKRDNILQNSCMSWFLHSRLECLNVL